MRLALPTSNGRVSPVFDVARQLLVLDVADGQVTGRHEEQLEESVTQKMEQLSDVDLLICGAISWPLSEMLATRGIRVIPFIAGKSEEIICAFMEGRLEQAQFAMPGCCGRKTGGSHQRRCRRRRWQRSHPANGRRR